MTGTTTDLSRSQPFGFEAFSRPVLLSRVAICIANVGVVKSQTKDEAHIATGEQISPAAPHFPDRSARTTLREALAQARFREKPLRELLGVEAGETYELGVGALGYRARRLAEPLRAFVELFVIGRDLPTAQAEMSLSAPVFDACCAAGLATEVKGTTRPTVRLSTIGELVIASDRPERHRARKADYVLGPGGVTRRLADFTIRRPVESVLDLGCGAGVLGALAASHAERVVATDLNERAVAFSRFNAELNDIDHMECRAGSVFEPVAGERFDLILCNAPYVISPRSTYLYRDGGTELCRRIVREAAPHLTDAGTFEMLAEWPEREGADWREELISWFADAGCDARVLRIYSHDPATYVSHWLAQEYDLGVAPEEAFDEWTDHLERLGIKAVGGGLVVLRRSRHNRSRLTLRESPAIADGPAGDSLVRWLDAEDSLACAGDDVELLDTLLIPAPNLERRERQRFVGNEWSIELPEFQLRDGFRFGARVDTVAAELVGLLDGRRTPREAVGLFTKRMDVPEEWLLAELPGALRRLVALGLLVPLTGAAQHNRDPGRS